MTAPVAGFSTAIAPAAAVSDVSVRDGNVSVVAIGSLLLGLRSGRSGTGEWVSAAGRTAAAPAGGVSAIARSANAVIVRLVLTPTLAGTAAQSQTGRVSQPNARSRADHAAAPIGADHRAAEDVRGGWVDRIASVNGAWGVPDSLRCIHAAPHEARILSGLGLSGSFSVLSRTLPFGHRRATFRRIALSSDCITVPRPAADSHGTQREPRVTKDVEHEMQALRARPAGLGHQPEQQ